MRILFFILSFLFIKTSIYCQIAQHNNFPTMQPFHVLDDKLENISFALSMRIIVSDYNGPLVRLRRSNDNQEMDFFCSDNDIVNISAINTWRNGNDVFIHTWYDQSGLERDAIQANNNQQPQFNTDNPLKPYFKGDAIDDYLVIDTPNGIQDVTNNGNQGTVLIAISASKRAKHDFGVLTNRNRWSAHISWSDNRTYFDPGFCCNSTRSFENSEGENVWRHYTFIKTNTNVIGRKSGIEEFNGAHNRDRCTRTEDFAIGWASGNGTSRRSDSSFLEMIMYNTDIASSIYEDIENNSITFWNL